MTGDDPESGEAASSESNPDEREPAADPLAWSGPNDAEAAGNEADDETVSADTGSGEAANGEARSGRVDDAARRGEGPARDEDAPLSDLAASVEGGRDAGTGTVEGGRFEEQDVTPIDADAVWERIEGDDHDPEFGGGAPGSELDGDAPAAGEADREGTGADEDREEHDVDAGDYCKRCPYFSTPPEVRCTHPGTEIAEVLDVDRFRVVDCPKVRETERLERL